VVVVLVQQIEQTLRPMGQHQHLAQQMLLAAAVVVHWPLLDQQHLAMAVQVVLVLAFLEAQLIAVLEIVAVTPPLKEQTVQQVTP
jgi:hypothetical protein